jgi:pimeloyl-ACP methyl ester carboxylesterase
MTDTKTTSAMVWTEQQIDLGHMKLAYKCWGQATDKPAVILLHGWLDNANSFDGVLECLPNDRLYLAFDLPGHGHSDHKPAGQLYHFLDSVADLKRLFDTLLTQQIISQPPWLIGHSLGAALSSVLVSVYPELVKGVCFIEALGPISSDSSNSAKQLKESIDKQLKPSSGKKLYPDLEPMVKARQKGVGDLSYEASKTLVERAVDQVEGGYQWRADSRLRIPSAMRLSENQCKGFLTQLDLKMKVILAEQSLIPAQAIDYRLNYFKGAEVVTLPGGHHLHMEESTEAVAGEIANFISEADK